MITNWFDVLYSNTAIDITKQKSLATVTISLIIIFIHLLIVTFSNTFWITSSPSFFICVLVSQHQLRCPHIFSARDIRLLAQLAGLFIEADQNPVCLPAK